MFETANKSAVYARKVIAQLLNLSEKRVKQLTDEGVIAEESPGYYKLASTVQGYIKYLQGLVSDDYQASTYNTEKARLTKVKREDAELDLKLKRNELHQSSAVEFIMANMIIAFKSKLEVLPYKVLPKILDTPEGKHRTDSILGILKDSVDEALNELSEYNPELFDEDKYLAGLDDTVVGEGQD